MDAGTVGAAVTVVFFVTFIGIVWWAFHRENKKKYEEAAQLPFQEDAADAGRHHTL